MKRLLPLLMLILAPGIARAQESVTVPGLQGSVTVPWTEFQRLYRESVVKEFQKQAEETARQKEPCIFTIHEAVYSLRVGEDSAEGEVRLAGRVVSGPVRPIPLFGKEMILTGVSSASGGSLICAEPPSERATFLPADKAGEFQLALSFLARVQEDRGSRLISFDVPATLRNTLQLELPEGARLLEAPGIAAAGGKRHFSSGAPLRIRFLAKETLVAARVEIDTFSRIRIQGARIILTTTCAPVRPLSEPVILRAPKGAEYLASSLPASRIKKLDNDAFEIAPGTEESGPFWLRFALQQTAVNAETAFLLPRIDKNNGNEGNFIAEEPPDGQVRLSGKEIVSQIPVSRLGKEICQAAGTDRAYMRAAPGETIGLTFARFQTVSTPPVVLDALFLFTSFEENGNTLSTLVMDVPPEAGPRLRLPGIADATIWSLSVNGETKKVYSDSDAWVVPLAENTPSHVELALLRKGQPLGLRGRLETIVPQTGFPSQRVCVGIALPARVQLMSIEGPVSPAPGEEWKTPRGFVGKPHYFSRSFHNGEEMRVAVSYKEPIEQKEK